MFLSGEKNPNYLTNNKNRNSKIYFFLKKLPNALKRRIPVELCSSSGVVTFANLNNNSLKFRIETNVILR